MSMTRATPGSQTSLREANRARIVDAIKRHGGLTQVELAGATGLSPATVSNIVKELTASGVLHTTPSTRSGRRAQHVTLARALGIVAGVHFSQRHMRVALSDVANTVVAEHNMPLAKDHRADNELDKATRLIADMLDSVDAQMDEILAVGIAVPAPVDIATGEISRSGLMRGWDGISIADLMHRRIKRPVYVDNEANLGALAEFRLGAARGRTNVAYLRLGQGIGAGLIINGAVFRGFSSGAGEFGHMTIDEHGPLCRCGNRGCLEAIAGGPAILDSLREGNGPGKLSDVIVHAIAGDPLCTRAIADAARHIGIAAANVVNLIAPERIVVGGELARAGELLLGPLRHSLERSVVMSTDKVADIVQGQLGERAELMGAVLYAIDRATIGGDDYSIPLS
ncbi:ROK family transcriptional regulator [Galbitalea soli]|uniref:ROK family transcriptional regulator n=2 Tax=Galbitalea soli TaxID=1268042 RepID=A0A7C9PMH1_9MICO|nr:ROK family transcriptional regulator [Galbitalea soli]NYJ31447.1 putative NBD/HSP70 family sugar kinase [Galbitalea soli]